jgi:hypothetical protein
MRSRPAFRKISKIAVPRESEQSVEMIPTTNYSQIDPQVRSGSDTSSSGNKFNIDDIVELNPKALGGRNRRVILGLTVLPQAWEKDGCCNLQKRGSALNLVWNFLKHRSQLAWSVVQLDK